MSNGFYKGWAEDAGKAAGAAERGDRVGPAPAGRRYIPVLPHPSEQQIQNVKNANRRHRRRRAMDRNLEAVLDEMGDD
jgi:hypothetical protein